MFLVNERDALLELLVGLDERRLRNAVGRLFLHRLHQDRELGPLQPRDPLAARDDHEVRHVDVMIAEDFFRDALVLAKDEPGRAAAGEGHALHFEKRNDVLVEPAVVLELVGQVENHVGREALQFLPEQIEIVEDGEMLRRVAELAERGQDVRLGLPILGLHLLAQVLVDRRGTDGVEKGEDFEFLFHAIWCA